MPDYQKMYFDLFHATCRAIAALQDAQQKCEAAYIGDCGTPLIILSESMDEKPGDAKINRCPNNANTK